MLPYPATMLAGPPPTRAELRVVFDLFIAQSLADESGRI
jgi:hypothetical protein